MPVYATSKAKLYIGGAIEGDPLSFYGSVTATNFEDETWVQIKRMENIGRVGDTSEIITFNDIDEARVIKAKGLRDAGTMELVAGIDYADPGQQALLAAEATDYNYKFRLVFNDAPPGGTPSERLFVALVMSSEEVLDQANSIMKLNSSLAITSNTVRINAATAP